MKHNSSCYCYLHCTDTVSISHLSKTDLIWELKPTLTKSYVVPLVDLLMVVLLRLGNTTVENKVVQVLKGISQKENCSESTPLFFWPVEAINAGFSQTTSWIFTRSCRFLDIISYFLQLETLAFTSSLFLSPYQFICNTKYPFR